MVLDCGKTHADEHRQEMPGGARLRTRRDIADCAFRLSAEHVLRYLQVESEKRLSMPLAILTISKHVWVQQL